MARAKSSHLGSPPLVRERPSDGAGEVIPFGITPARAGKTWCLSRMAQRCEGSPPLVRERRRLGPRYLAQPGSPPLVRERLILDCDNQHNVGNHPRSCGKDACVSIIACCMSDHPRSCGKDPSPFFASTIMPESPPLVRERLHLRIDAVLDGRITPARAGKTSATH